VKSATSQASSCVKVACFTCVILAVLQSVHLFSALFDANVVLLNDLINI